MHYAIETIAGNSLVAITSDAARLSDFLPQAVVDGPNAFVVPLAAGAIACTLVGVAAIALFRLRAMRKLGEQSVLSDHVFAAFFGDANVGIAVLDEHGAIVRSNSVFETMIGYGEDDLIGMLYFDLVDHPDDGDVRERIVGALDRFGESRHLVLRRSDGSLVRARFVVTPAPATLSRKNSVVFVEEVGTEYPTNPPDGDREHGDRSVRSQSDRRTSSAESVSSGPQGALESGSFLANLHDEIKTPLTVILGSASLLKSTVEEDNADLVAAIEASSQRLLDTVDGLLLLARLRLSDEPSVVELFDVRSIIMEVAANERAAAAAKDLKISTAVPAHPVTVRGDRDAVTRIVDQLVQNAVKFTEAGSVHVTVEATEERVTLCVSDTGSGFDSEAGTQLFSPFFQASRGSRRKFRGTGLGLTVVSDLVTRIDGTIEAVGDPGAGSTFTVEFPRRASLERAA